jgi:outer membrane protein TolC
MNAAALLATLALAQAAGGANVLTLEDALRAADARSVDLAAARARLLQVEQLSAKVWSSHLPQVLASGTWVRNERAVSLALPVRFAVVPGTGEVVPTASAEVALQAREPVSGQVEVRQALLAPTLWPALANAREAERIARLGVEDARRRVLFGVAQAYYAAARLGQAVVIQERRLGSDTDHERDARILFAAGTTPRIALVRAEIDRSRAEEDLRRARIAHAEAKLALATMLDREPDFDVVAPPEPVLPADLAGLEAAALRDRPDVLAAAAGVRLAERARDGKWLAYAPSLGAFGSWRWTSSSLGGGEAAAWAVGIGLSWTLFDGGLREAELREEGAKVAEARAARRGAENRAREDVRRALLELESARAARTQAERQVVLAREQRRLADAGYRAGAGTWLERSDAGTALVAAELGHVSDSLAADLAALRALEAAGAFARPRGDGTTLAAAPAAAR